MLLLVVPRYGAQRVQQGVLSVEIISGMLFVEKFF